jgi:hypothetical protein
MIAGPPDEIWKNQPSPVHPSAALAAPCAVLGDACLVEPAWVRIRRLRLGNAPAPHRLVHFTELHNNTYEGF